MFIVGSEDLSSYNSFIERAVTGEVYCAMGLTSVSELWIVNILFRRILSFNTHSFCSISPRQ